MAEQQSIWRRDIVGWSLYDFANTIYSMNILSLYLKRYIVIDLGHDGLYFDIPYALSMLLAGLLLPALGAMSDHAAKKKLFIFLFTFTCCAALGLMSLVPQSAILLTVILFAISNFCYEAGMPFYNALLYSVADGRQARYVSGVGVAFGYVGSIVGMILVMPFVTGNVLGLDIPFMDGGDKSSAFLPTAVLFMLFAIPMFLFVKEREPTRKNKIGVRQAYREVWEAITQTRKYPGVARFLIADYFFEDAVATVILNIGLYCTIVIGLEEGQITLFLVVSTVSAVIGSFVMGKVAQYWSLKKLLNGIVIGWVVALLVLVMVENMTVVWILGSIVGVLLGGIWTTSRPLLAELVPREDLGKFFGLFSLSGRAAAVVGPMVWGAVVYSFQPERPLGMAAAEFANLDAAAAAKLPYRLGILSLIALMLIGLYIFRKVPDLKGVTDDA